MLYTVLALLTAGVSLAMGTISFFIGLKSKDKTDLIFGFMGLSLFVFFLLPPVGFILVDHPPYPLTLLVKRIFIYTYYALIPWFVLYYTGYGRKIMPILITGWVVVSYIVMLLTTEDSDKPVWSIFSVIGFGLIFLHALRAGLWQHKHENRAKSRSLLLAMAFYGILFLLAAINQLSSNFIEKAINMKLFFPMHLHALLFMLIIGLRIVASVYEKYQLEKKLKARDRRWQSFMQNAPVIVRELDKDGNIIYVNDFGASMLGYNKPEDLLGLNWFDTFLPANDVQNIRAYYLELMSGKQAATPYFQKIIRSTGGKDIPIAWVNFVTYSDDGEIFGVMSIGRDLTREENANGIINQLKLELEKEKIGLPADKGVLPEGIIGTSQAIGYAIQKAQQVAPTHAPVLLEGETGVGKDMMADLIHKMSLRNNLPIIKVNCGALPGELIEDELFGHEKGAFTSAIQSRKGRFELADGGTIFLDEIGELPLEMQPKLLRVLQNGEFERVGGQKTIKVDVRVIAATNKDLQSEVSKGRFRDDLFYRLNVFPITIPPLRKRREDLPVLIHYFIMRKCQKYGKSLEQISKADMQRLLEYTWPGNVRELKNVIERAVITSNGSTLKFDWFLDKGESIDSSQSATSLEQIEKEYILKVMNECHWKINGENGVAERLGMHPNTLRSKMKKLGITRPVNEKSDFSILKNGTNEGLT